MSPDKTLILAVDDRAENLMTLEHLLEAPDIAIVKAHSGNEALALSLEHDFALILLDVQMPGMDGFETAELLRSRRRTRHIPIIFITAISTDDHHVFKGYEKGAVDYLAKPLDRYVLKSKVRVFVELERHRRLLRDTAIQLEDTIHRLRISELNLKASEEKYRILVENAGDAILIVRDGSIRFANARAADMFQQGGASPEGMPFLAFVRPDDLCRVGLLLSRWSAGEAGGGIATFRCHDISGEELWVEANAIPLPWEGQPAVLLFIRDISRQRMLEEQLHQSQKMEAIGTLAGGIAHDFNNILGMIIGYAEMTRKKFALAEPARHNLDQILKAGFRAREVVNQILTFSHRDIADYHPVAMTPLVREALELIRSTIPSTVLIRASLEDDGGSLMVNATPVHIHQVLMNLCINAAHAMEPEGGTVTVQFLPWSAEDPTPVHGTMIPAGIYARLVVSDEGRGMDEATLKKIFNPYFTTKAPGKGTGMGLAVVHGIIQKSGGFIAVKSAPGEGTRFDIFFPLVRDRVPMRDVAPLPSASAGKRILLVDDEALLMEVGQQMLEMLGHRVVCQGDPEKALEAVRADPDAFDLVITDVTMPGMSGDVLLKRILEIRPDMPVLLSTGYHDAITPESARELGGRGLIIKPVSLAELGERIEQALAVAPAAAPEEVVS